MKPNAGLINAGDKAAVDITALSAVFNSKKKYQNLPFFLKNLKK